MAEVLSLLFLLLLRMLSALAAPPWCVSSAHLGTPAVSTRCLAAGCPLGFPCWLFFSEWQTVRETLHRGAGGGLLLPGLRVSGSGCRLLPDPFRRFSVPPLADLEGQGCRDWVVGVLRLGYCLPFLGTPHVPLFPSQCLFPAPSPSQGLFWSISPWSWFPRLLWSLLHSLLQASTAFCSWCCRPRGHGVRSSPSPISFSLWTCHTFSWGPFRLCSCR